MSDLHDETTAFLNNLPEIEPGVSFRFGCGPQVECFNACCGDLNLMLTPYDVLRLRKSLGESSKDFVMNRTEIMVAPDTGLPMLRLKMKENIKRTCPFVTSAGCSVYSDRPGACRTYPLGRATRPGEDGGVRERFFLVEEPHCKGFKQESNFTVPEWLKDQGLEEYNRLNDKYMELMSRQKDSGKAIDANRQNLVLLALYQLDGFAEFLREMKVLDRVDISDERRKLIETDETARLEFALDWLELILFGQSANLQKKQ